MQYDMHRYNKSITYMLKALLKDWVPRFSTLNKYMGYAYSVDIAPHTLQHHQKWLKSPNRPRFNVTLLLGLFLPVQSSMQILAADKTPRAMPCLWKQHCSTMIWLCHGCVTAEPRLIFATLLEVIDSRFNIMIMFLVACSPVTFWDQHLLWSPRQDALPLSPGIGGKLLICTWWQP